MKVKVSYGVKLIKYPLATAKVFKDSVNIFQKALEFICYVVEKEWNIIKLQNTLEYREHSVEKLIHKTKDNLSPKYTEFDNLFYKFPSYLRRCAIDQAIGAVSSHMTNLENYENEKYLKISNGRKFSKKPPKFNPKQAKYPVLFKDNMFKKLDDSTVQLKVFKNNDWVWIKCNLRNQDIKYIQNNCENFKELSPILESNGLGYKLRFTFEKNINLPEIKSISNRKILSVDLGVNTSAVCTIMNGDGTVLGRKFIDMPGEKDQMYRLINRISKRQSSSGKEAKLTRLWGKVNGLKKEITNKVSHKILEFATEQNVDVIVFERLGVMKLRGYGAKRNRKRIHHWNKRTIIKKICAKAHTLGIRYSVINPKNTSALAFDGSGKVERFKDNFSICKFTNGKIYNCDLNASYNIGARYFIREFQKSTSESKWLQLQAEVPEIVRRTQTTLAVLTNLVRVLQAA